MEPERAEWKRRRVSRRRVESVERDGNGAPFTGERANQPNKFPNDIT